MLGTEANQSIINTEPVLIKEMLNVANIGQTNLNYS